MLALSRKKGQSIIINGNIEVTILDVSKEQVKIGIEAPRSIPVHRKEIYIQIQEENKQATETAVDSTNKIKKILKKS